MQCGNHTYSFVVDHSAVIVNDFADPLSSLIKNVFSYLAP